jgi:hypothetical protein
MGGGRRGIPIVKMLEAGLQGVAACLMMELLMKNIGVLWI